MKSARIASIVVGALALAGSLALAAPAAERSERIRQQIADLLARRRQPEALPVDPPNPFAPATTGLISAGPAVPAREPPRPASAELLARHAARLRIGGLMQVKDQMQIVINDSPWREGDSIIVQREPRIVQLQVVRIAPGLLTLRLDDAELTLRF